MHQPMTFDLFAEAPERPGALGCRVEIAATMAEALRVAATQGVSREAVAERMGYHLGDRVSGATLNGYTAPSHTGKAEQPRDISLLRAMAFDAAIGQDVLLGLYARQRGEWCVVTAADAAYIELGRIHQQARDLAERKRALQSLLKTGGKP